MTAAGPTALALRTGDHRLFVALDSPDKIAATALARRLAASGLGLRLGVKLGLAFVTACGPAGIAAVAEVGLPVFLDLKFHDIPNTVAGAVRAACRDATPICLTVHAAGGPDMLRAAAAAAAEADPAPTVLAVTVLTSLDDVALAAVGQPGSVADQVARLARLSAAAGCGGIVCSPREAALVRGSCGPDMTIVVPGIRPAGSAVGDQCRVATPAAAIAAGADHLVVGRPITAAADPVATAAAILAEIDQATDGRAWSGFGGNGNRRTQN